MSSATVFPVGALLAISLTLATPLAASEGHDHHHGEPTHDHHDHSGQGDHRGHDHHAHDDPMHDHDAHEHRWEAPSDAAERDNPHAADEASIRMGRDAYKAQCLVCHGEAGAGDGPQARALESRPADLREHAGGHTAGEYHWMIREGSGEMPAFAGVLDDDEIWHVVNYIRYELADAGDDPSDDHDGQHAPERHDDHDHHNGGHHGHAH
ncbi:cytochrome c [Thioalkalivibrio sp. ALJ1]|uniref:c-type cytochrome n=1 Tax=Thioalkalivibrio sp. ALJ1 TaxID=1158144 RepID=UPI00056DC8D6|nr:cytochrome c [Thioalkalivibrio sp. ALJ1]